MLRSGLKAPLASRGTLLCHHCLITSRLPPQPVLCRAPQARWHCRRPVAAAVSRSMGSSSAELHGESDEGLAVVLVDHGSKRAEANRMLEEFAELYRQKTHRSHVEVAHMELARPSIADAVAKCAAAGAKRVVVAPYFLSRGRHITEDIPALVASAQAEHPGVECIVADPIGIDPLMVELIEKRVADTLPR